MQRLGNPKIIIVYHGAPININTYVRLLPLENPKTCVTTGNITLGKMYKNYKSLPLELFRTLAVGA